MCVLERERESFRAFCCKIQQIGMYWSGRKINLSHSQWNQPIKLLLGWRSRHKLSIPQQPLRGLYGGSSRNWMCLQKSRCFFGVLA